MQLSWPVLMSLALMLGACGTSASAPDAGAADSGPMSVPPGEVGSHCEDPVACESGRCSGGLCTAFCAADADCPEDWYCGRDICVCRAAAEVCDGRDNDCDTLIDEGPRGAHACSAQERCADASPPPLSILLVIDDSGSMGEELASFTDQVPHILRTFADGDLDRDGVRDFEPPPLTRIGVVITDMGTGDLVVPTCNPASAGDGVLRTVGNRARTGCSRTYPALHVIDPSATPDELDRAASDLSCVVGMGTFGCSFERPLAAMLKAVTPSTSALRFEAGSVGHADSANAGFLEPGGMLAVLVLSDEDDCSAHDLELFDPGSESYPGELNLRCFEHPDAVHPVQRYVTGLIDAVGGDARDVVYGVIAGLPAQLAEDSEPDYDSLLSHPLMIENIDPTMPTRLETSCNIPGRGLAFPPRRLVQVGQLLSAAGAATTAQSICQHDFTSAVDVWLATVCDALTARCR